MTEAATDPDGDHRPPEHRARPSEWNVPATTSMHRTDEVMIRSREPAAARW